MVTADVPVFGDEASVDLRGGMPSHARGGLVGDDYDIDDRGECVEGWRDEWDDACVGFGLSFAQRLENGLGGMPESPSEFTDGSANTMRLSALCVFVHHEHPPLACGDHWAAAGGCSALFPFLMLIA